MNEATVSESFALSFCTVLLKRLLITLQLHLISPEASHIGVKMKKKLYANAPKGSPQQIECADKEQFKIK